MCRHGSRRLPGYGDLRVGARAGDRGVGVEAWGAIDAACAVTALAPSVAGSRALRWHVNSRRGKAIDTGCW
jgi:hypothetical protein